MSESVHSSPRKSDGGSSIHTHRTSVDQSISNSEPALANNSGVRKLTAYEKYMEEMNNDPRALKEVTLGKRIAFYKIRNELGSGNFSQVKMGLHALTKEKVAIKILDKTKLDQKTQRLLSREISCMETLAKLHLVMEYAPGGELFTKISNEGKIAEAECKPIYAQVISAVYHMHSKNIIHRDLKAENVFYAANGYVKVGDFGFSTYCKMSDTLNTFCGSPPYAAPELFKDENYVGPPVDTWALGIMLYFMITGVMPFRADTVAKLKKCILDGQFSIPSYVSSNCQQLIRNVLKQPPGDRFTIEQIKNSQWLQGQDYPPPHPSYHLTPCFRRESASSEELNVLDQLKALGIEDHQLESTRDQDSRNSITGTYRIALHRLQRKRLEPPVVLPPPQTKGKSSRPSSRKKSKDSNKNNKPSKLCTIL
ncbi:serine/threonine-protein kinase NIM1-like isoform X2 [Lytechinus variegatus]|uniref:serine/threonine-protein kinase NIM1-like isoform X2 n=1 Tax=Lytechinus variegatus TaxID=7654 RepID=UPI001BB10E83|nr:serine/threonine-protein kinase NIM1-like isoform X2 [Lytechinus variegatus]